MTELHSVAEVKNRFSEFISRVAYSNRRMVITKRKKPIAALVNLETLRQVENIAESKGLASVIGKWKDFEKISPDIKTAYRSRNTDNPRNVSF